MVRFDQLPGDRQSALEAEGIGEARYYEIQKMSMTAAERVAALEKGNVAAVVPEVDSDSADGPEGWTSIGAGDRNYEV